MEEGVADAAWDCGVEGAVEEVHGAAPVSTSGGHGGAAEAGHGAAPNSASGGHGGEMEVVHGAAPVSASGGHGGEAEAGHGAVQASMGEGHGRAALSPLRCQGGTKESGHGAPKEGDDATVEGSAWREGGPPKKRAKTTKASIVPCEDDAPAVSMCFPPRQSLEPTTTKKRKHDKSITGASKSQMLEKTTKEKGKGSKSGSGGAKRSRTQPICVANKKTFVAVKVHAKSKSKEVADKLPHLPMVPHDSPAMSTRSKKMNPASPAMSTRSKRRLSL